MAECITCGVWFSSSSGDMVCPTCDRAMKRLGLDIPVPRLRELVEADAEGRVIILPAPIGSSVWCIDQPCGGCPIFNVSLTLTYGDHCQKCDRYEVSTCTMDYDLIPEIGKTVFFSKAEAEATLKANTERDHDKTV